MTKYSPYLDKPTLSLKARLARQYGAARTHEERAKILERKIRLEKCRFDVF